MCIEIAGSSSSSNPFLDTIYTDFHQLNNDEKKLLEKIEIINLRKWEKVYNTIKLNFNFEDYCISGKQIVNDLTTILKCTYKDQTISSTDKIATLLFLPPDIKLKTYLKNEKNEEVSPCRILNYIPKAYLLPHFLMNKETQTELIDKNFKILDPNVDTSLTYLLFWKVASFFKKTPKPSFKPNLNEIKKNIHSSSDEIYSPINVLGFSISLKDKNKNLNLCNNSSLKPLITGEKLIFEKQDPSIAPTQIGICALKSIHCTKSTNSLTQSLQSLSLSFNSSSNSQITGKRKLEESNNNQNRHVPDNPARSGNVLKKSKLTHVDLK